jgi:diacylglycerol diphosphate phosphatase / phosphatidate phosphatase
MDARHHPFDVLSGSLLGILCAWGAYRQYFPPVSETWRKGRAYPIRSWGKEPRMPDHVALMGEDEDALMGNRTVLPINERATGDGLGHRRVRSNSSDMHDADTEHGGNVFRQQIQRSQTQRDIANVSGATFSSSTAVGGNTNILPRSSNNISSNGRGRQDVWDESSSSDGTEHETFELQPTYTLSDAHRNLNAGATYDPAFGALETENVSTKYYGSGGETGGGGKQNTLPSEGPSRV